MFDWLVEVNSLPGLTIELRRAHQRSCKSATAKVWMHDQQPHEKLIEETFVEDDEAADHLVNPRDCDASLRARLADKSAPRRARMDSFVQRTNVLKIPTGSPLDYRHKSRQRYASREG